MKKHEPDTTHPLVAVMGDDQLTQECMQLLQAAGIDVIGANDEQAIASAAPRLTAAFELTLLSAELKRERLTFLDAQCPLTIPIVSSSVTVTALEQSQWMTHPARLIGFSGFPTLLASSLIDLAPTPFTADKTIRSVRDLFGALGKETVCVQDRTGVIVPAVIAQCVNEALMTVHQNVASARDIDTAMKLAAGFPLGPIEWGEKIGFANIAAVLDARRRESGEERWRTSSLLRQLAVVGTFWHEPPAPPEYIQEHLALDAGGDGTPGAGTGKKKKAPKKK